MSAHDDENSYIQTELRLYHGCGDDKTPSADSVVQLPVHDPLMSEAETADYLGLTRRTLQAWRVRGDGPPFFRVSPRVIRYRRSEVDAWLEKRRAHSTSEYDGE